MLQKLEATHRRLRDVAAQVHALRSAPAYPDGEQLATLRWELASLSMRHLSMLDRFLLANLADDPRPGVADTVLLFRRACQQFLQGYSAHAKRWPADRVAREWHAFRVEAGAQAEGMERLLDQVDRVIFPLACPVATNQPRGLSANWASEGAAIKQSLAPPAVGRGR